MMARNRMCRLCISTKFVVCLLVFYSFSFSYKTRSQCSVYNTPFDVVGGPIGPRFCAGDGSDTTPTTLVETDDVLVFDAFVVRLEFSDDTAFPIEPAPVLFDAAAADVVIAFVDDFVIKNFSNLAIICFPYVYFRNEFMCGRILCIKILRCVGSDTSIIF